jgi:hypothetical protein
MFVFSGRFNGIEPLIYMRHRVSNAQDEIIKRRDERLELIKKYKTQLDLEKVEVKNKSIGFYTPDPKDEKPSDIKQEIENMYNDLKGNDLEAMVQQSFQNELIEAMNEDLEDQSAIIEKVGYQDFVNYGVIAELVGRIGFIAAFNKLGEDEIIKILKRPTNNIIDLYKNYFHLHQDSLEIKEEVYPLIAEEVAKRQIGTRSINTILVQLFQDLLFIAPDKKKDKFVIDAQYFLEKIQGDN